MCGFRPVQLADFDKLRQWLIEGILPQEAEERRIRQALYETLKPRKIEPPAVAQIERLARSAQYQFEISLCAPIVEALPESCCQALDALTGPQEDLYVLNPEEIRLNQLREEAGPARLKGLTAELTELEILQSLELPKDLFIQLYDKIVERYRLRVKTETLTELRGSQQFILDRLKLEAI